LNRLRLRAAALLSLLFAVTAAQAAVRASLDSDTIAPGATLQLTLEHDGQTNDAPDLSALKQDFDVLSSSRSSNMQIINGNVSSQVRMQLSLAPKHSGDIRIPAISWGSDHSDPLVVKVGGANNAPAAGDASRGSKVFMESSIDAQQPYVQAAVKVTVRLYAAVPLYHASLDLPASNDVLVQQIGTDHRETQLQDGQRYQVIERQYEIFPQRSGPLTIPGPVLDAQIGVQDGANQLLGSFKDFFGSSMFNGLVTSSKPIRVHGDDIALNVRPRPAGVGEYWLPAQGLSLQGDWHPQDSQAKVGDPVTLDLHLKAEGLTAAQLPDLSVLLNLPPGLKAYPDQAKLDNDVHGNGLVGSRDQSIALIADQPGHFAVPALTLHWWDTRSNQPREVSLPSQTFTIIPAPSSGEAQNSNAAAIPPAVPMPLAGESNQPVTPRSGAARGDPWKWASLVAAALWIVTLIAWFVWRRSAGRSTAQPPAGAGDATEQKSGSISKARGDFQNACRSNDAGAARASLLAWISAAWPDARLAGLRAFACCANQPQLSTLLLELDRACYGGGRWHGSALLLALPDLPKRGNAARKPSEELAPLYR